MSSLIFLLGTIKEVELNATDITLSGVVVGFEESVNGGAFTPVTADAVTTGTNSIVTLKALTGVEGNLYVFRYQPTGSILPTLVWKSVTGFELYVPPSTKTGGYHRNTAQTISTIGSPSAVSIAWQQSSYGDITTISHNTPNGANFTVNQHGIYLITLQVSYGGLSSATLTDRTLRTSATLTRGAGTSAIIQGNYDFGDNIPPTPAVTSSAVYELKQGDQLFFQVSQYLSAGSFTLQSQSSAPNDFDYNTYWTWTLLQELP